MDFAGKIVDLMCGAIGPAAARMVPSRVRNQVLARVTDHNPFAVLAGNHDLIRAVRIAWVEAALEVLKAAAEETDRETVETGNRAEFDRIARKIADIRRTVEAVRDHAFDRRNTAGGNPIDNHIRTVLHGTPELAAPGSHGAVAEPLTRDFIPTLAALTGPEAEIPPSVRRIARDGLPTHDGKARRDFGELVFAAFAELIKDPTRYPQARVAFHVDMMNTQRVLLETILASVTALRSDGDAAFETAATDLKDGLTASIGGVLTHLRSAVDGSLRPWLEIQDYGGAVPANSSGARRAFRQRPTNMLVARYRIVPFLDRDGILAEALAWATDTDEATFPGRLYVAPGGFGKTRLALELTETLRDQGWRCRFLSRQNAENLVSGALPDLLRDEAARGVLLVFDYAESQADLLKKAAVAVDGTESTVPIRLLALARSPEGWWDGLSREDAMARVFAPTPYRTIADRLSPQDRTDLLDRATTTFTQALASAGEAPPAGGAKRYDLSGRDFDRPLMVAMAAFLGARGIVADPDQSLLSHMFHQEQSLWKRALGPNVPDNDRSLALLQGAAAQITLVQGATADGAGTLLAALRMGQDHGAPARETALAALERIYGTGSGPGTFLHPIQPDILGEHVALRVAETVHTDLIEATMRAALTGPKLHPQDPGLILTVLVRALRPEHDAPYRKNGPTVQQIAETAIARIATLVPTLPRDQILRLDAALPRFALPLLDLSLAVARRVADTAADPAEQANALNNLAIRLSETGDRAGALEPARRAVEIYEQLARANPAAYLPVLATSLNNLATFLSETGDRAGALEPARRAVEIREQLARANPAAYLPDLASSLNTLANGLSETGDRAGALEPARRAVEIREQLARANPAAYLPVLASSLNNLANRLSETGDRAGALEPARRAVEIREQLARANPAAYLPVLASSLNNLATFLSETGDRAGALEPARRAIEIYEQLARANPAAYLPDLATSLWTMGDVARAAGDLGASVTAYADSLTAFRTCFDALPQRFGPYLAAVAERLGDALVQAGRGAEVEPTLRAILGDTVYQTVMQERAATAPSPAAAEARRMLEGFVAAFNDAVSAGDAAKIVAALEQAAALERHLAEHAGDASLGPLVAAWAGIKQQIAQGSAEGDGESDAG